MLGILKQIYQEKEEEMVTVDIWCHFGHAYLIKVDEGQSCRFYESLGELVSLSPFISFKVTASMDTSPG